MNIKLFSCLIVLGTLFWGSSILAMEFQTLGPDAVSMGGAAVASSRGPYSGYNNPALLPEHKHKVSAALSVMYGYREYNIAESIDNLSDIDIDDTIDQISASVTYPNLGTTNPGDLIDTISPSDDVAAIKRELNALNTANGIQMTPGVSLAIQAGNFGFGVFGVSEIAGIAVVDSSRLDLIYEYDDGGTNYYFEYDEQSGDVTMRTQADYEARSFEYAIDQGLTYIQLNGLAYAEIPVSYGRKFQTGIGDVNLGGSLKIMPGYTLEHQLKIDSGSEDIDDDLDRSKKQDTSFGIDFGALYKPPALSGFSIGIVGKNLNTPEFDTISGGKMEVEPQVRTGLAYDLLGERLSFAVDADLTKNETFIPNYDSQYIGGGVRFQPFSWFSIRGGAKTNFAESSEGAIFTAGLGLGVKWLSIDIVGQFSNKEVEIDDHELPRYAKVQLTLVSKWF